MPAKRYSTEQIVSKLRQAEVELRRDLRVPVVCKKLGISEPTYYRWRKEYGGLRLDQAKRLKELERETTRLKKLVARRLRSIHVLETLAQLFVTYGVPAHLRSACYEQVVKALGAVGSSNRGTDTGSGSVEPAHRASSGLIPEERRVPGGSTSSCLRREELRTTVGMASSPVGAGASGFYAAIDSSLHTWSASNAVRFLTTANASCSSLVMQAPIACIGGKGRVTRCVRRS